MSIYLDCDEVLLPRLPGPALGVCEGLRGADMDGHVLRQDMRSDENRLYINA